MSYLGTILAVVILDQLTKAWVLGAFQLYESKEVISGFFNLVYVTNSGAAFSILADVDSPWRHYFFLGVGVIAIIGLTIARFRLRAESGFYGVALALICGGAIGNLTDRIRFGSVVDFLDFQLKGYHWPAFNVADSAICIGAGLFMVASILASRNRPRAAIARLWS